MKHAIWLVSRRAGWDNCARNARNAASRGIFKMSGNFTPEVVNERQVNENSEERFALIREN